MKTETIFPFYCFNTYSHYQISQYYNIPLNSSLNNFIYSFMYLAVLDHQWGMWDLVPEKEDCTGAPCTGRTETQQLDRREAPLPIALFILGSSKSSTSHFAVRFLKHFSSRAVSSPLFYFHDIETNQKAACDVPETGFVSLLPCDVISSVPLSFFP